MTPSNPGPRRPARLDVAALVVLAAAFALRLYRLDAQSLWWDEALSLKLALASGIEWRPADAGHPPLYDYFVLKPWVWLAGPSEFAARFLSVAFGVLAVALAYHLGQRVADRRAGLIAAGLVSLCGIQWWYSQEVRMYTLIACEILLLLILLERVLARPAPAAWPMWVGLSLLEFAALYTQYLAAVVVAYVNLVAYAALLWRRDWPTLRRWTLAQVLAALLILPVLPWALGQVQGYVPPNATPLDFLPYLAQVWLSYLGGPLILLGGLPLFETLALIAAALFGLAALSLTLTNPTRTRDLRLLSYALVPLLVIFIVMWLR
ncbi:MAG: glycosyltransferase family 39 protein, partial [Anaerolineae bacterium]|nr:glycosyltransferase family 39 protein [Anaerolineae bacterium]